MPLGFVVFAGILLGLLVFGLVTLNALVAQSEFRIHEVTQRIEVLSEQRTRLGEELARRSAPGRLADWARRNGLRLPQEIYLIRVPGGDR